MMFSGMNSGSRRRAQVDVSAEIGLQEEVLVVDKADDVIEIVFVDRQAQETRHRNGAHDFADGVSTSTASMSMRGA